ncbi:unnamed protein product [Paramecium pentaurelia]|uniref:Polycystin cation channel PKD1/PKD2 domain-containing protein n=1 Tax=Paramecium pentaurelia TaxID=43138 RepID=A0A8S1SMC6_9CILI|nr:unnamed protein product [Paramecium pentaurelia]
MEIDPESKARKLRSRIMELNSKMNELQQEIDAKETRNTFLEREVQDSVKNLNNMTLYVSKQIEMMEAEAPQQEILDKNRVKEFFRSISKQVLEKFGYHIDKYFRYLEECVQDEFPEQNNGENDNQYQPPPMTCAIQVKCPKTLLSKDVKFQDDNVDYVTATFRYSKINSFQDLKKASLVYWNIYNIDQVRKEMHYDAGQTSFNDQPIKSNGNKQPDSQVAEQIDDILQKQQPGLISPGSIQTTNRNLVSPQIEYVQECGNTDQIMLEKFCNRYEIVNDNQENIQNTELIERYYNKVLSDQNISYLSVTLKKKRMKTHRRGQPPESRQSHITSNAQPEKSQISHPHQSANITFDGSKVSEEKPLTQIDENEDEYDEQQEHDQQDLKIGLFRKYVFFFNRFPLLKKQFVINVDKIKKRGRSAEKNQAEELKGEKLDDNHICILFILIILMALNILFLYFLDNGAYTQQHIKKIEKSLNINKFLAISSIAELQEYYINPQGLMYQFTSDNSDFKTSYEVIGALRFRQLRTRYTQCPNPIRTDKIPQITCNYEIYNDQTFFTDQIGDGKKSWMRFTDSKNDRITEGQFSNYDSSGYIQDISPDDLTPVYYIHNIIEGMFNHPFYFHETLIAQIMTMTVRSKNDGMFVFIEFLVEVTGIGIYPKQPNILPFSPNIFGKGSSSPYSVYAEMHSESPNSPNNKNIGYILYLITVLKIIVGIIYTVFQLIKMKDSLSSGIKYFISVVFLVNSMSLILNFSTADQALQLFKQNINVQDLVQKTTYVDLGDVADTYKSILVMTSLCICAHLIRIYLMFNIFKSLEQAIEAIESQYLQLLSSFTLLFLILSGFAIILTSQKGPYFVNYSLFARSFAQLILMLCNSSNIGEFYDTDLTFSMLFMIFFYFILYQFLFGILAIIYIDSYRQVVISQGQPESKILKKNNLMNWLFNWLPNRIYQKKIQE